MEFDKLNLEKISFNKKKSNAFIFKKPLFYVILLSLIIILLIFIILNLKILLNKYTLIVKDIKHHEENKIKMEEKIKYNNFNKNEYVPKIKYDNDIKFYKQILKLYHENKTEFRIRGRQRIMEICGKVYNESNIKTIQDKINWLLIHENPDYKSNLADKILLHEYSKKILGKDICVPILKIYNSSEEINSEELPEKFVLKCNHGCGMNILCTNKSRFNLTNARNKLDGWLNLNYGFRNFEFQYININKKIFAEQFLLDNINDYKVYCFNGEPKFIRVQRKLPDHSGKINNYYNLDWTLNDIETGLGSHFVRRPDIIFEKPKNLDLMIDYARKLSSEFAFVRVDFYNLNGTIYLGEMTFSPSNAIFNCKDKNQSLYLGELLDITKVNSSFFPKN